MKKPIKDLLAKAAKIIGDDAQALFDGHTINGKWISQDAADLDALESFEMMASVRRQLLELASADVEIIRWHPASEPPDDDTTVLTLRAVDNDDDDVWPGFVDSGTWHDNHGCPIRGVKKWAEIPSGTESAK